MRSFFLFVFLFANSIKSQITVYTTPGWNYVGCIVDGPPPSTAFAPDDVRVTWDAGPGSIDVNQASCLYYASVQGYAYAGVEYGTECWGGSSYRDTSYNSVVDPSSCSFICSGNLNENCGAGYRMNMWARDSVLATVAMISTDPAYAAQISATSAASAGSAATAASDASQTSAASVSSDAAASESSVSAAVVVSDYISYVY